ncbi:MAG: hypothetical protein ACJAZ4_002731, partial [Neptuniibacter pectenicola]
MKKAIGKSLQRVAFVVFMPVLFVIQGCETVVESTVEMVEALPDINFPPSVEEPKAPNWVRATGYAP